LLALLLATLRVASAAPRIAAAGITASGIAAARKLKILRRRIVGVAGIAAIQVRALAFEVV